MKAISEPTEARRTARLAPVLFTTTIFLSAALLFFVQPLFTRIVLPNIGGASAVWTTAMLFFQTVLILGYLYAHLMTRLLSTTVQMAVHLCLWATALLFLPLAIPAAWSYDASGSTVAQTLMLFAAGVGLPFAVLSANAPLIQAWYARSDGPSAEDPYFLYGASNLGSLIALLAFPLAAEPLFGAWEIGAGWAAGFVALGALLLLCGLAAHGTARQAAAAPTREAAAAVPAPRLRRLAGWAFLAFIPSSMMLGVTSKISADLGSFPLVWVVPLSLYLMTFVLAFSGRPWITAARLRWPFRAGLVVLVVLATDLAAPGLTWGMSGLLLAGFFAAAVMAHRRLYEDRPDRAHLTLFYVTMSVGGALGGLFNSVLAPVIFDEVQELRIVVALAALLLVARATTRAYDLGLGLGVGLIVLMPFTGGQNLVPEGSHAWLAVAMGVLLLIGLVYLQGRGAASVAALVLVLAGGSYIARPEALFRDRSFFGQHRVVEQDGLRKYANGTTVHGSQRLSDYGGTPTPLTYYHRTGPMGQIMASESGRAARSVGIVGLGLGSLACYRLPGQNWHFYEIDRIVDDIARDPGLFTFMSSCAGDAPTHLGDARVVLEQQENRRFDILVIDAYSSDSVPVHLTTTEAIELYRKRLAPGGILVFHISNRYYAIDRPIGRSAAALRLAARIQRHGLNGERLEDGALPSIVVVIAEDDATLAGLAGDNRWQLLESDGGRLWTDDFSNLLSILR